MTIGLDSSIDRPTPQVIAAARAAGVGFWMGYLATRPGVGLLSPWDLASFDIARQLGSTPVAMASGFDDPAACAQLAAQWRVRLCLDCEGGGLRPLGPWTQGWVDTAGSGIYGVAGVHGVRARFHILARYPCVPPQCCDGGGLTWPMDLPVPPAPVGWQSCGTHTEFGLSVDRGVYDTWFATSDDKPAPSPQEEDMIILHPTDRAAQYLVSGHLVAVIPSQADLQALLTAGLKTVDVSPDFFNSVLQASAALQGKLTGTLSLSGNLSAS